MLILFMGWPPPATHAQCTNAATSIPSNNVVWQPLVSSPPNTWVNNYPPTAAASACTACPTLYTHLNVCEGNRVPIYMCASNVYTISLCNSTNTAWNSYVTITNTAATPTAYVWDDNGCGGSLSTITYNPPTSGLFFVRISGPAPGCALNTANCGRLEITCAPVPPPPSNDNPCTALALPVNTNCIYTPTGTAWATGTAGIAPPSCGTYPNNADVWYSAVVPASGNLAVQTNLVGATNIAMALYTAPNCSAAAASWTQVVCNADLAAGSPQPYIIQSGLTPLTTVFIRVWPEGIITNGGTFEICAMDPVVPVNDQPCLATTIPVTPACTAVNSTTENATATTPLPPAPGCGVVTPIRDVWFTLSTPVVAPPSTGVVINTAGAALTDGAMAIYTGTCAGLTLLTCSDPAGSAPPTVTLTPPTVPQGTTLYIRVWNKTAFFGPFTICAKPTTPPPNDDPCGAIALTPQYGCLYSGFTTENATQTGAAPAGTFNVPTTAQCGGVTFNDVWFTAVVPPNGQLRLDTDDGGLVDGAMEVYRVNSGSCGSGNLNLNQIASMCNTGPSSNSTTMPALNITSGLTPGETIYIRFWRQTGASSTFSICASRTDNPPGTCVYTLRMNDSAGDGWNGSNVTIGLYPGGVGPPIVSPPYTIIGSSGSVVFSAAPGDIVELTYTAVGGFQNQISYSLLAPNGGVLLPASSPPNQPLFLLNVDNLCNNPPFPHEDCVGAVQVCNNSLLNATPLNTGAVDDLNIGNRGCLITDERQGVWYKFYVAAAGQLGFSVGPGNTDYDYGVWGPYSGGVTCPPPTLPSRCSWADGAAVTGLNFTATDISEGVFGDGWTRYLDVAAGEWYLLFLDNWYLTGNGFTLTWNLQGGATINCSFTPIELIELTGLSTNAGVQLDWSTASENNVSHFEIERSVDGSTFRNIGHVAAVGTTGSLRGYRSFDERPEHGINHYRLRIVEEDGGHHFSNSITVPFALGTGDLMLSPNPARENITVHHQKAAGSEVVWHILDASGRYILAGKAVLDRSAPTVMLDIRELEPGSYQLVMTEALGGRSGARFVKQ